MIEPTTAPAVATVQANAHAFGPGWSIAVGPDAPAGPQLPGALPPLPPLRPSSPAIDEARAQLATLTARLATFEGRLAAAYEAGDVDAVLAVRRESEEVSVRMWAAERDVVTAELLHCDDEVTRIEGFLDVYGTPLDSLRSSIRQLQVREQPLVEAVAYIEQALGRLENRRARLAQGMAKLQRGPASMALTGSKGGWG